VTFQRVGTGSSDSADEYWALDNIAINSTAAIPEADSYVMMLACLGVLAVVLRRRARAAPGPLREPIMRDKNVVIEHAVGGGTAGRRSRPKPYPAW
jgi:hypothetical protein